MKVGRKFKYEICGERTIAYIKYMEGKRIQEIAAFVHASKMTVYRWAKRYGWIESYKKKYENEKNAIKEWDKQLYYMIGRRVPKNN